MQSGNNSLSTGQLDSRIQHPSGAASSSSAIMQQVGGDFGLFLNDGSPLPGSFFEAWMSCISLMCSSRAQVFCLSQAPSPVLHRLESISSSPT